MIKNRKISYLICVLMIVSIFSPAIDKSSASTPGPWRLWIDDYNHVELVNNSVISANSSLIAFSNYPVKIGFIYVNGTQNQTLENWTIYNESSSSIALNFKISDGSTGDRQKPFSLILQPNIDPYVIKMVAIDSQCNHTSITYIESTNDKQDPGFDLSMNTNSTTYDNFNNSCVPDTTTTSSTTSTTSKKAGTPGFEYFLIIPSLILLVQFKKKHIKK